MRPARPVKKWATGGELVKAFAFRMGAEPDRMAILGAVWERELGHLSRQWALAGVRRGIVLVKPRSAAAAQELSLRSAELARSLNKHFNRPWIKAVKASLK